MCSTDSELVIARLPYISKAFSAAKGQLKPNGEKNSGP